MKVTKVYGIHGLLEWHGIITSNGIKMKVDFTNGSVTAFSAVPATFMTSSPLTQHIIENSDQFKGGRIRLVGRYEFPDEDDNTVKTVKTVKAEAPKKAVVVETHESDEPNEVAETVEEADENVELKQVEVSCVDDAKEYLVEHFGVSRTKLRSAKAIAEWAKANGIEFIGI